MSFENAYFAMRMKQNFNTRVTAFESDETESALRKYLKATGRIGGIFIHTQA